MTLWNPAMQCKFSLKSPDICILRRHTVNWLHLFLVCLYCAKCNWQLDIGNIKSWNNGKEVPRLDLTSSTTPGQQIHKFDHTRTANPCDWLPCRHATLPLVGCPHSLVYLHLPVVEGLIFCISSTPHLGTSFPLFHGHSTGPGQWVVIFVWWLAPCLPGDDVTCHVSRVPTCDHCNMCPRCGRRPVMAVMDSPTSKFYTNGHQRHSHQHCKTATNTDPSSFSI